MSETILAGPDGWHHQAGEGMSKAALVPAEYSLPSISATALAELYVRRRLHVSPPVARLVVALAGLGNMMEVA